MDSDGEHFAREVGKSCAKNRISVVSGGARGVDQIAMSATLEAGGVVIGVLADDLLKKSLELERRAIADDRLLLISSYHPTAHFTIGRAMERNKLIYALADCALVVSSDYKKGGTWTGVAEELERDGHRPIFVRSGANVPVGNKKLLGLVVHEYDFDAIKEIVRNEKQDSPEPVTGSAATIPKTSIYESVLPIIMSHLKSAIPKSKPERMKLAKALDVSKTQLDQWIDQAIETGPKTIYGVVLPVIISHLPFRVRRVKGIGENLRSRARADETISQKSCE